MFTLTRFQPAVERDERPAHKSWMICRPCEGTGEENTLGRLVEVTHTVFNVALRHELERTWWEWQPFDPPPAVAYRGPCRACRGLGRLRPEEWREPIFAHDGRLLDPGSVPELMTIYEARKGASS